MLFIDIVGYSKLLINEQSEQIQQLKQIVRGTEQVRLAEAEGKLLRLPTGDGGALVFRNSPEAPVLCALEIGRDLKKYPELHARIGIHSGPVNEFTDLNAQANIAFEANGRAAIMFTDMVGYRFLEAAQCALEVQQGVVYRVGRATKPMSR